MAHPPIQTKQRSAAAVAVEVAAVVVVAVAVAVFVAADRTMMRLLLLLSLLVMLILKHSLVAILESNFHKLTSRKTSYNIFSYFCILFLLHDVTHLKTVDEFSI